MKGTGATAGEIWDAYLAECDKIGAENDKIWQDFETSALNAITSTIDAERDAAQETVEIWRQAIKDIENARMGLAEGKSIAETFIGDEEGLSNVIS
jgi:hypothetical protein